MPVQINDNSFTHNNAIYHGGRGGAGNYRRLNANELKAVTTNSAPLPPSAARKVFFGGRGGRGNVKPSSERAMFSFDEELERDRILHEHHAPVYSIGRGGMGNIIPSDQISTRSFYSHSGSPRNSQEGAALEPRATTSSAGGFSVSSMRSGADRLWERVRGN